MAGSESEWAGAANMAKGRNRKPVGKHVLVDLYEDMWSNSGAGDWACVAVHWFMFQIGRILADIVPQPRASFRTCELRVWWCPANLEARIELHRASLWLSEVLDHCRRQHTNKFTSWLSFRSWPHSLAGAFLHPRHRQINPSISFGTSYPIVASFEIELAWHTTVLLFCCC